MLLRRIVSGGQTGVDLAAWDAALAFGLPQGGWVPEDRCNEDGAIPPHYRCTPVESGGRSERTMRNVRDSDMTLLIYRGRASGGTKTTLLETVRHGRPVYVLNLPADFTAADFTAADFTAAKVESVIEFLEEQKVEVLNVAGPPRSLDPEIGGIATEFLVRVLERLEASRSQL